MLHKDRKNLDEEAILLVNKGKRGLFRIIFGRTSIVVLLLALQFILLFIFFYRLRDYTFYGGSMLLALIVALFVVNRPDNPASKITWILLIMLAPVFGIPFYFFVNAELGHRLVRARLAEISEQTAPLLPPQPKAIQSLETASPGMSGLARYLFRTGSFPVYQNSGASYYPLGENAFEAILEDLSAAQKFIFLEYFIITEGYMWGRILKILEQKAAEGVEVRVLYDGTCALYNLPYQYPEQLEKLGIQCRMYAPLRPLVSTHYNNRDHRKILVVDGRCAFTGGINLSDEYINRTHPHGHWKDVAIRITGEAVRSFTHMFLQMWDTDDRTIEDFTPYLNASRPVESPGWVLPYGDSPFNGENMAEMVYMDILNQAKRYVHIMTPYLIIDHEMVTALLFAAKRGVDVKLITPGRPDKKTIFALTRSYYSELLAGGVQIYEYTPGFVHAKTFVSDDSTAVSGSVNLDYRSLYLHFECAALLYNSPAVADIEADFQATLAQCRAITLEDCRKDRLTRRLTGFLLRPLAPLM